jgi:hypothetical protein
LPELGFPTHLQEIGKVSHDTFRSMLVVWDSRVRMRIGSPQDPETEDDPRSKAKIKKFRHNAD